MKFKQPKIKTGKLKYYVFGDGSGDGGCGAGVERETQISSVKKYI